MRNRGTRSKGKHSPRSSFFNNHTCFRQLNRFGSGASKNSGHGPLAVFARSRSTLFSLFGPLILGLVLGVSYAPDCEGYSVLTHEALIDAAWTDSIVPVL